MKKLVLLGVLFGCSTLMFATAITTDDFVVPPSSCQTMGQFGTVAPGCACGEPGQPPCNCAAFNGVFNFIESNVLAINTTEHVSGGHNYTSQSSNVCIYNPGVGGCSALGYISWYQNNLTETGTLSAGIYGHSEATNQQNVSYQGGVGQPLYISAWSGGAIGTNLNGECGNGACLPLVSFAPPMGQSGSQPQFILGPEDAHFAFTPATEDQEYCPSETGQGTPIVLIRDGKGWKGAFTNMAHGIDFDLVNTGYKVRTAWTNAEREIGILVMNRDAYNQPVAPISPFVLNAKTVFGGFTNQRPPFVKGGPVLKPGIAYRPNGFYALKTLTLPIPQGLGLGQDSSNGGLGRDYFGAGDGLYDKGWIGVWVDTAHDGIFEHGRFYTLKEWGIKDISLDFTVCQSNCVDENGVNAGYIGHVDMIDPNATPVQVRDVIFPYKQYMLTQKQVYPKVPTMTPEQCDAAMTLAESTHNPAPNCR